MPSLPQLRTLHDTYEAFHLAAAAKDLVRRRFSIVAVGK
jgi:hypothetical protein